MTAFDNKEKGEENKYAHDKEVEFRIFAKYHGLLAEWVARESGLDAEKAKEYKGDLIAFDLGKNDEEALFGRVKQDLLAHNVTMDEHKIREKMYAILQVAKEYMLGK